jgi:F0F1-type ATP synthase assembly protein I
MTDQNSKKNQYKKWLGLINIPFQMGIIIYVFTLFGIWLDKKFKTENNVFTIVLSLFSVFLALYNVLKQVQDLNKNNND